jgi:hypothetical protein
LKELEMSDPAYMTALRTYQHHVCHQNNTSMDTLLLRINSALHVKDALAPIVLQVRSEYRKLLDKYRMCYDPHMSALEGVFDPEEQVCAPILWPRFCYTLHPNPR